MKKEDILKIIEKHKELNRTFLIESRKIWLEEGNEECRDSMHSHAGAITGLEMLRMEIEGEKEY